MNPERIRDELRTGRSRPLFLRRSIGLLSALGLVDFSLLSLYQMGVLKHLPDPPGGFFDSDGVNASLKAYPMGFPDAPIGTGFYALNLVLASARGSENSGRHSLWDLALGASALFQAGAAAVYMREMARQKKACAYCLFGAVLNFAALGLSLSGAWRALSGAPRLETRTGQS